METVAQGLLTIGFFTLLALIGFALVQRVVPLEVRESINDVAGFVYAVLGVLYTVLLAFVVVIAWEHFETATSTAQQEANQIAGLYGLALQMPVDERGPIQDDLRTYTEAVVNQEWPLMAIGKDSPAAWSAIEDLRKNLQSIQPKDTQQASLEEQALSEFHDLENDRRLRLLQSRDALPPILWVVLNVGAALTIAYTFLFGVKNVTVHALIIASLTVTVVAILFTIQTIEVPFSGGVRVDPSSFEAALQAFQGQ